METQRLRLSRASRRRTALQVLIGNVPSKVASQILHVWLRLHSLAPPLYSRKAHILHIMI